MPRAIFPFRSDVGGMSSTDEKLMKASSNYQSKCVYEFDSFVLDEQEKVLLRDGERVPLTPKAS
jgi:hypothetical protein